MNFTELLKKIDTSLEEKKPFVAFRKPDENTVCAFFQKNDFLYKTNDFLQKGFVFAPFSTKNDAILIPFENSNYYKIDQELEAEYHFQRTFEPSNSTKKKYSKLVDKAIDFIKSGKAQKIVVSRREDLEFNNSTVSKIFRRLLSYYDSAMVYVWFHPKVGLWLGATPETLLSVVGQKFKTMALAGTQPFQGNLNVMWQQKEMDEQQYVTDYIISKLKGSINDLDVSEPYTLKAGNLLHLKTDISGTLDKKNSLLLLITSLHPTPAVCGLPKEISQQFILENENYNREFYTGFLGELNMEEVSNLFVNLRCMKIVSNNASLFIGGGITGDSITENEWQETVEKSSIIKKVL